jgi:hypothetical protein
MLIRSIKRIFCIMRAISKNIIKLLKLKFVRKCFGSSSSEKFRLHT